MRLEQRVDVGAPCPSRAARRRVAPADDEDLEAAA